MKQKVKLRLFGCCIMLLIPLYGFNQTPANDPNWKPSTVIFEEFTSGSIDESVWEIEEKIVGEAFPYLYRTRNRIFFVDDPYEAGDKLLKIETIERPDGNYESAGIKTTFLEEFEYGFFEMRCKFPEDNGRLKPAFWLHAGSGANDNYREIDIFEYEGADPKIFPINVWWQPAGSGAVDWDSEAYKTKWGGARPDVGITLYRGYHVFGLEWNSEKINFYLDNVLIRSVDIEMLPYGLDMHTLQDFQYLHVTQHLFWPDPGPRATWDWYVDYVKVYNLEMDCSDPVTEQEGDGFDFDSFNYKVKKSFTLKNTTVTSTSPVALRATDFVELKENFTVPLGKTFSIIPTPCH